MEAIMAILRMMIVDYLDAEMNCGWCVFFVDRQQMKWALTILVFWNLLMPPTLTEPCNFELQSFSSIVRYRDIIDAQEDYFACYNWASRNTYVRPSSSATRHNIICGDYYCERMHDCGMRALILCGLFSQNPALRSNLLLPPTLTPSEPCILYFNRSHQS